MSDETFEGDAVHTVEEVELMVGEELTADEAPAEAVIVARNSPEVGRQYVVATPENYPAPDGTVDDWVDEARDRYPLDAFEDLDGGEVVARPQYDEEYHRYGEIEWVADEGNVE